MDAFFRVNVEGGVGMMAQRIFFFDSSKRILGWTRGPRGGGGGTDACGGVWGGGGGGSVCGDGVLGGGGLNNT